MEHQTARHMRRKWGFHHVSCNGLLSVKQKTNYDGPTSSKVSIRAFGFSHYRPQSEGDNVLGSVRPSVRLSVRPSKVKVTYLARSGRY